MMTTLELANEVCGRNIDPNAPDELQIRIVRSALCVSTSLSHSWPPLLLVFSERGIYSTRSLIKLLLEGPVVIVNLVKELRSLPVNEVVALL